MKTSDWQIEDLGKLTDVQSQLNREEQTLKLRARDEVKDTLYLWESSPAIVVTRRDSRMKNFPETKKQFENGGILVCQRLTGGGTCPQGPGIVNLAAIYTQQFEKEPSIVESFHKMCGKMQSSLAGLGIETEIGACEDSFCDGRYNLLAGGKKLIGTSQRWLSTQDERNIAILFHALVLYQIDPAKTCKMLNEFNVSLGKEDNYHANALINITDITKQESNIEKLKQLFIETICFT
jgi:octanoyl-[GcvH]:protein N-octanoyltransferase